MKSVLLNCKSIDLSNCTETYYCKIAHKKVAKDIPKNCLFFANFCQDVCNKHNHLLRHLHFYLRAATTQCGNDGILLSRFLQKFREINVFTLLRVLTWLI